MVRKFRYHAIFRYYMVYKVASFASGELELFSCFSVEDWRENFLFGEDVLGVVCDHVAEVGEAVDVGRRCVLVVVLGVLTHPCD